MKKKLNSCAECKEYPCNDKKIQEIFKGSNEKPVYGLRQKSFKTIQEKGYAAWDKEQQNRWMCKACKAPFTFQASQCPKCNKDVYSAAEEFADFKSGK